MSPKQIVRSPLRLALLTPAMVAIAVALGACGSSSSSSGAAKANGSTTTTTTAGATASGDTVNLKLIAYKPAKLTVSAGATVTWHQMDPGFHTVTSGTVTQNGGGVTPKPDGTFHSGELATGKSFSYKFATPGTYTYFCEIHPATMRGEITVR